MSRFPNFPPCDMCDNVTYVTCVTPLLVTKSWVTQMWHVWQCDNVTCDCWSHDIGHMTVTTVTVTWCHSHTIADSAMTSYLMATSWLHHVYLMFTSCSPPVDMTHSMTHSMSQTVTHPMTQPMTQVLTQTMTHSMSQIVKQAVYLQVYE